VQTDELEQILRDLPGHGTLIKDRKYRQVWRFEVGGSAYYLKFYPRGHAWMSRDGWRRRFRGSPAAREFQRLQWLQKAKIPSPRAIAYLAGYTLAGRKGDAVILKAIEPAVPLDELLNAEALAGVVNTRRRRRLVNQLIEIVRAVGAAGFGHTDLHLGNFLVQDDQLYLIDAYELHRGGLRTADVMMLGASVSRFATRADIVRGWRALAGEAPLPRSNPLANAVYARQVARAAGGNRYVGRGVIAGWRAVYFRHTKFPRRWSIVSRLEVTEADWQAALPPLLEAIQARSLPALKQSASADVYDTTLRLGGVDVPVIVKVPHRRYAYRHLTELGRGSRSHRAWKKAWHLVARDLPTAWPIAYFEQGALGYVSRSFIVFEKVPGPTLWKVDLEGLTPRSRDALFRRTGRLLRQIEQFGFSHFDAKASNWIVRPDEKVGPMPVLIDVDGIRRRHWPALGIQRLLRSLLDRKQYSPDDSRALCEGYAPHMPLPTPEAPTKPEDKNEE
jgi:tRNA A-37 threonylcarbamoyl transferase component Bud32